MQKINKGNPPAFFSDFIKKSKPKDWNDIAPIREQLRKYILENEQKGCCVYTEIKIEKDKNCHIDHFHTRNLFKNETFAYNNLLVSCNSEKYGAKYKDKQIKSKADYTFLINPTVDTPSDYIEYTFTGEMEAIGENQKGIQTINYFNLNEQSLVNRRKRVIKNLGSMKDYLTEDELVAAIGEFETMIRQLYRQG